MVEARDIRETVGEALADGLRLRLSLVGVEGGVEARLEQAHEQRRQIRVREQRRDDVLVAEREPDLTHVARERPQMVDLTPRQPGREDELVERVVLGLPAPGGEHRLHDVRAPTRALLRRVAPHRRAIGDKAEVVDVAGGAVGARQRVRTLVRDLHAEVREDREYLGEHERLVAEDLEASLARVDLVGAVQRERRVVVTEAFEPAHVGDGLTGGEVVGVTGREPVCEGRDELAGIDVREPLLRVRGLRDALAPRARHLEDGGADVVRTDVRDRRPTRQAHRVVDACERLGGDAGGVVDRLRAVRLGEVLCNGLAHAGVVAIARQVDEDGDEAAVVVIAQEDADVTARLQAHDLRGDLVEALRGGLEQLVARVALEHVEQVAARVRVGRVARPADHLGDALGDDRDARRRRRVGAGGVQAEEATLAGDVARLVECLHADVVEVGVTMHARTRVGLRQREQLRRTRRGATLRRHPLEPARRVGGRAQDAEGAAVDGTQHVLAVDDVEGVLAIAEEGEVVLGEPGEEAAHVGRRELRHRHGRVGSEVVDDGERLVAHALPVVRGGAHVVDDVADRALDLVGAREVAQRRDVQVDPRLLALALALRHRVGLAGQAHRAGTLTAAAREAQLPRGVAPHRHLRVQQVADAGATRGDGGDDRIDDERHVVRDDADDGARSETVDAPVLDGVVDEGGGQIPLDLDDRVRTGAALRGLHLALDHPGQVVERLAGQLGRRDVAQHPLDDLERDPGAGLDVGQSRRWSLGRHDLSWQSDGRYDAVPLPSTLTRPGDVDGLRCRRLHRRARTPRVVVHKLGARARHVVGAGAYGGVHGITHRRTHGRRPAAHPGCAATARRHVRACGGVQR